ncbi:hypothetical protein [Cerasicoccus frondis]|uniref:hypothetical protein n=1 Tax=Cerasicoccus frondis TaxID=490090 RepID=UPI002852C8B6|nr:hypothetical protein [Cerasicoccus frondis]
MDMLVIILILVACFPLLAWWTRPGWAVAPYLLAAFVSFYFIFAIMGGFVFGMISLYLSAYFEWINVAIFQESMALVAYMALFAVATRSYFKEFGDAAKNSAPAE